MSVALALMILSHGGNLSTRLTPEREAAILCKVADEYALKGDERKLLYVIRRVENGRNGFEMGVETERASRYANDPTASLVTQARWAAGTIIRRYNGSLHDFAARWCPANAEAWETMARQYMSMEAK